MKLYLVFLKFFYISIIYIIMESNNNNLESILLEKIQCFSNYLISICNNQNHINQIKDKIGTLKFYEILLFINFLTNDKIDTYINELYKNFDINDTSDTRNDIKNYLIYFLNVKNIMNDTKK